MSDFKKQFLQDSWLAFVGVMTILGGAVVVGISLKLMGIILRWYGIETDL